jgi:hypothetical protein
MQCNKCGASIDKGEEKELRDQILCEDCYIDALSPVKVCDPWALYNAKSLERNTTEPPPLTPIQSEILDVLKGAGSLEPSVVLLRLKKKLTIKELEREFAVLRHMDKVRAENAGDRILWRAS